MLAQKSVHDVLFGVQPGSTDKSNLAFFRSLGLDAVYVVTGHADFPAVNEEDVAGQGEVDGVRFEVINNKIARDDCMTSSHILERFKSNKTNFEARQKAKKEPELRKSDKDFLA